ncbi:MAG: hypothetical protein K6T61_00520 [Bryobacteraceae bacterium]|nr:hypothetical protein [Bryobacteraceae bacterium]
MRKRDSDHNGRWVVPALFLLVFLTHGLSPIGTSSDSRWTVPLALSLLRERNTDLDEYHRDLKAHRFQGIQCVGPDKQVREPSPAEGCPPGGRAYYSYPIGTPVVAAPVLLALDAALRLAGPAALSLAGNRLTPAMRCFFERRYTECFALAELVIASFVIATAAVVVFLTARLYLSVRLAMLLAVLFAYATPAYSTGSRALWQHGPAMLMLALALYLLARGRERPSLNPWSAVPLVLAFFIRPLAAVWLVVAVFYLWSTRRAQLRQWVSLGVLTSTPFVLHNWLVYGTLLQPYYLRQQFLPFSTASAPNFLSALAGHLSSPSRGLLIFSPVLAFSLVGMVLAVKRGWAAPLPRYLMAGLAAHWLVISWFADWPAGHCYGPRYFTEATPVFLFFLIPWLQARPKPAWVAAAFVALSLWSGLVHFRGAAHWDVYLWNADPRGASPEHAWDWKDPQFLRGLVNP